MVNREIIARLLDIELEILEDTGNRDSTIEVFQHFPRTANVKRSRDQGLAVRFEVHVFTARPRSRGK